MNSLKKIGIIRCKQTNKICSGSIDLNMAVNGTDRFESSGPVEVINMIDCGGCPGHRITDRVNELIDSGAEGIALASCITGADDHPFPCYNFPTIQEEITEQYGQKITLIGCAH